MRLCFSQSFRYSLGLHLALAALVVAAALAPAPAPRATVSWIELVPSAGTRKKSAPLPLSAAASPSENILPLGKKGDQPKGGSAEASLAPSAGAQRISIESLYRASVRQALEREKIYPPLARRLGQTGTVVLKFVLDKNGALLSSQLSSPSPFPVLNEAARALLASAKFEPIPEALESASWEFILPIAYRIN